MMSPMACVFSVPWVILKAYTETSQNLLGQLVYDRKGFKATTEA